MKELEFIRSDQMDC